jgi:hypothetical protein
LSIGTAWILAKDNSASWKYWMMTNWHVTVDWMYSGDKFNYVWWDTNYGDYQNAPSTGDISVNNGYHRFPSNSVVKSPEGFNDFSSSIISTSTLLTPFYEGVANNSTSILSAGYPFNNTNNRAYFKHSVSSSVVGIENLGSPYNKDNWIKLNKTVGSTGNWYELTPNTFNDMESGSSGSMIIKTTTHEVIGLYWGGYADNDQDIVTQPRGVILNTDNHSEAQWYYKYDKIDVISKMIGCSLY